MNGNDVLGPLLVPLKNLPPCHVQPAHIVITQRDESHLRTEFVLVLGCSEDSEMRGRHENYFRFGEWHDRFVDVESG